MKIHVDPAIAAIADSPATMYNEGSKYLGFLYLLTLPKKLTFTGCLGKDNQKS
jgi:hypothetical protein